MKGAILLLFQWSTKSFQKEKTFNLEYELPVHFIVSKCYAQGTPRKKQHRCFFRGAPNIPEKIFSDFCTCTLGRQQQTKIKILESGHYTL